ncbi:MAG: sulfurtransferase-like selenium metabolism protein YedF [Proteobacteria bacterium]|nr:sulfurtransferase-like selenium metabolism protein YedF [Pseudomonadota bacterium]
MKKSFDLRNLECPKPVIETKKIIEANPNETVEIILNSSVAKENVLRLLRSLNIVTNVESKGEDIVITFNSPITDSKGLKEADINCSRENMAKNIIISSKRLGQGDERLGEILIKSFIYTLCEREIKPKNIFFVNSGVFLTVKDSPVIEELKKLVQEGTNIFSCGTCLDYYNLKDKLAVGKIGNMGMLIDFLYDEGIIL